MKVLESLLDCEVNLELSGRQEVELSGTLIDIGDEGLMVRYSSHSRTFIDLVPWKSLYYLSFKQID